MFYIMLGAPGSGKGTRCEVLKEMLGIEHISTGNLIRENKEIYEKCKNEINKGYLLSDTEISNILEEKLKSIDYDKSCVLDGYPRTINQAYMLDKILNKLGKKIDKVFLIEADYKVIYDRIMNRVVCKECGRIYNKNYAIKNNNQCQYCGGDLTLRKDDNEETLKNRIKLYDDSIDQIKQYYAKLELLEVIDAEEEPQKIVERI